MPHVAWTREVSAPGLCPTWSILYYMEGGGAVRRAATWTESAVDASVAHCWVTRPEAGGVTRALRVGWAAGLRSVVLAVGAPRCFHAGSAPLWGLRMGLEGRPPLTGIAQRPGLLFSLLHVTGWPLPGQAGPARQRHGPASR